MNCTLYAYSISENFAEGTCQDYKGNIFNVRTTFWDWFFDYGL